MPGASKLLFYPHDNPISQTLIIPFYRWVNQDSARLILCWPKSSFGYIQSNPLAMLTVTELVNGKDYEQFYLLQVLCSSHCSPQYQAVSFVQGLRLVFGNWKLVGSLAILFRKVPSIWQASQEAGCPTNLPQMNSTICVLLRNKHLLPYFNRQEQKQGFSRVKLRSLDL